MHSEFAGEFFTHTRKVVVRFLRSLSLVQRKESIRRPSKSSGDVTVSPRAISAASIHFLAAR
jgi:hypothetical protein